MFPFKIIDLTHTITPDIPLWPGSDSFEMTIRYDYHEVGCRAAAYSFVAGTGTHMDAPAHFIKDGNTIEQIPLNNLITQLCVIDVKKKVAANHDYTLSPEDIIEWENRNGPIPTESVVIMNTGWAQRWSDSTAFLNEDVQGIKHFPGFSASTGQLLLDRKVAGIGIDTFSLDAGVATTFPVHHLMLKQNIYFLECLANLDQLPESGAYICALPLKVKNAPEFPARVVAFVKTL